MKSTTATKSITSRIEWCRRQSMQAFAPLEIAGWQAEEDGLWDAFLNRDHTPQYQHCPPGVFKRYVMGFQDGHAMLRTAAVSHHFVPLTRKAPTGSNAGIDGMGDVSMRPIIRLTRRANKYLQECRVTEHHIK